jgi:hypothetical protein
MLDNPGPREMRNPDPGASSRGPLRRLVGRAADHFAAGDAEREGGDSVELWGRRIGRALSLAGVIALTWLLGVQLGWW